MISPPTDLHAPLAFAPGDDDERAPDRHTCPRHPVGPHDQLSIEQVLALLPGVTAWDVADRGAPPVRRLRGATRVLAWLQTWPGDGWQQRWLAARADHDLGWLGELSAGDRRLENVSRRELCAGVNWLFLARVIQPGFAFFLHYKAYVMFASVPHVISPELFTRIREHAPITAIRPGELSRSHATLVKFVLHSGKDLDGLTIADFVEYQAWSRTVAHNPKGMHAAWALLVGIGLLAPDTTLRNSRRRGQQSIPELVDFYNIRSPDVRAALIRYLQERSPALDYTSLRGLTGHLVGTFWADIERHHPGIDSLALPEDVALAWKERLMLVGAGERGVRPRKTWFDTLIRVRAFYLDIHEWALTDPSWARWAVPSPVRRGDTEGFVKARKQVTALMHQRIRERLPHLPALVDAAADHRVEQQELLRAAAVDIGATFTHGGRDYRRVALDPLLIEELATSTRTDLTRTEDEAFWSWAIIETLRHTGVRIEELLEITHLALVSYRLPSTGETVPLLQIVPSKSNEERLLLVSPELASVLAAIITRLRRDNGGEVPVITRYDPHERLAGPALPHLFQRRAGHRHSVIGYSTLRRLLNITVARTGLRDAAGAEMNYTAHDFRRMFITEAVTGGLPVHIAARVLGHHSITTTQSYLAVFQDDLIRAYRAYLDNRRAIRPDEEYREPSAAEWTEFQQHFELRKVELGSCGRPYGTPCRHEHACIRCPMLRVDPRQRGRLVEIIHNLSDRITEARHNGWLGEVQGLTTSLEAARKKLTSLDRDTARRDGGPTNLGLPSSPPAHHGR